MTSSYSQSLWTLIQLIFYRLVKRGMLSVSLYTRWSMELVISTLPEIPAQEEKLMDDRRSPSARGAPTTNREVVSSLDVLPSWRPSPKKPVVPSNSLLSHNSRPESRAIRTSTNRQISPEATENMNYSSTKCLFSFLLCQLGHQNGLDPISGKRDSFRVWTVQDMGYFFIVNATQGAIRMILVLVMDQL